VHGKRWTAHLDDHFYPEIIDPKNLETLPEGEKGELVLTTLTREGMPVLRFRTRDITALQHGECAVEGPM
jgi:phenylacetate-CoA ligase